MKRILWISGLVLVLVFVGLWVWVKVAHSPKYEGSQELNGLQAEVEVIFDQYGIPHITASSAEDAYRALGFVHAQDRFFQMDLMRRVGGGRLSELLGEDLLDVDKFFRVLGISGHAKASTEWLTNEHGDSEWVQLSNSYLEGINQFIEVGKLPLEYTLLRSKPEKFTLQNIHEIAGYMSFTFAMALKTEPVLTLMSQKLSKEHLQYLSIDPLEEHIKIPTHHPERDGEGRLMSGIHQTMDLMPVAPFIGSNAWVLGPEKTESGQVIFCNDTHIGFSQPSVWYEAHLKYPNFDFYGNYLAGMPFPLIGHSRTHSYGMTMFENDDFDLYMETFDPNDNGQVMHIDSVQQIVSQIDTIHIKGAESQVINIRSTPRGNIINEVLPELKDITEQPVSAWWVFLKEPTNALEALYRMSRADNINDFEQGVSLIHAPGLNIMYGDATGNIAWWAAGKLPVRPEGISSKFILDAASGEAEPNGWHPFNQNPMSINPPSGFVYSANNMPDTTAAGLTVPGYYYPGDRGKEISDFLSRDKKFTQADMKELQLQNHNQRHGDLAKNMAESLMGNKENDTNILSYLLVWGGSHDADAIGATIYHKWAYHTSHKMMSDELGEEWFEIYLKTFLETRSMATLLTSEESPWWDNVHTEKLETRVDILQEAFDLTISELKDQLGDDPSDWKWEKVISIEHEHALGSKKPLNKIYNVGPMFIPGNKEAVNKLNFSWNKDGIYKVTSGPAMRIIIDFADVNASESVLPTGQSGNVFSAHYKDQAADFAAGNYRNQWMDLESVKAAKHRTLVLTP